MVGYRLIPGVLDLFLGRFGLVLGGFGWFVVLIVMKGQYPNGSRTLSENQLRTSQLLIIFYIISTALWLFQMFQVI